MRRLVLAAALLVGACALPTAEAQLFNLCHASYSALNASRLADLSEFDRTLRDEIIRPELRRICIDADYTNTDSAIDAVQERLFQLRSMTGEGDNA